MSKSFYQYITHTNIRIDGFPLSENTAQVIVRILLLNNVDIPVVLVGLKKDLRFTNSSIIFTDYFRSMDTSSPHVSTGEGTAMAMRLGAVAYFEVSALYGDFKYCFDVTMRAALSRRWKKKKKKNYCQTQ